MNPQEITMVLDDERDDSRRDLVAFALIIGLILLLVAGAWIPQLI